MLPKISSLVLVMGLMSACGSNVVAEPVAAPSTSSASPAPTPAPMPEPSSPVDPPVPMPTPKAPASTPTPMPTPTPTPEDNVTAAPATPKPSAKPSATPAPRATPAPTRDATTSPRAKAPAQSAYREPGAPIPSKEQWLRDVHAALVHYEVRASIKAQLAAGVRKPLLNFDIDNTVLQTAFGGGLESKGVAIPEVRRLIRWARENGVAIAYNTGRDRSRLQAQTRRQLVHAGLPIDRLWLRPSGMDLTKGKQAGRRHWIKLGYTIVGNVGNHDTDRIGRPRSPLNVKLPSYDDRMG